MTSTFVFDDDPALENFFIFSETKYFREYLIEKGEFTKLSKAQQAYMNKDHLSMRGYAKGVPFDSTDVFDQYGNSWIDPERMLNKTTLMRIRFTISWETLRYRRSVETLNMDSTFRSESSRYGRCERISALIPQRTEHN
jgi:hypothetical protein